MAETDGTFDHARHLVETAMDQYDLNGWTKDGLINPDDVSAIKNRR